MLPHQHLPFPLLPLTGFHSVHPQPRFRKAGDACQNAMNMPGNTSEELTRRMHAVGAHCNKSGSNNNNNVVPVVHQHYQLPRIHYAYQPAYQHHYVFPNHYQPVYPANWNGWTTAPTYKASKPKKRSSKGKKGKKGSKSRSRKTR